MSRVLIVSSDCHAGLPDGRYRDYLDEDFREAYDRQLARLREQGDKLRAQVSQFLDEREEELAEGLTGAWDSAQRTKELDADGITAEVLFPDGTTGGNAPPFGAAKDAINLAGGELVANAGSHLKKKRPVILVCDTGVQSARLVDGLRKGGFESSWSLDGGLAAWRRDNLPVVSTRKAG